MSRQSDILQDPGHFQRGFQFFSAQANFFQGVPTIFCEHIIIKYFFKFDQVVPLKFFDALVLRKFIAYTIIPILTTNQRKGHEKKKFKIPNATITHNLVPGSS